MTKDKKLEIDIHNFNALELIDRKFTTKMKDLDIKDHKGLKVGKILASQYNAGAAVMEMQRLYKNGIDGKYFVDGDKRVLLWQPGWMQLIEAEKEAENKPRDPEEEELKEVLKAIKSEKPMERPVKEEQPK